jgi:hypothetical protein
MNSRFREKVKIIFSTSHIIFILFFKKNLKAIHGYSMTQIAAAAAAAAEQPYKNGESEHLANDICVFIDEEVDSPTSTGKINGNVKRQQANSNEATNFNMLHVTRGGIATNKYSTSDMTASSSRNDPVTDCDTLSVVSDQCNGCESTLQSQEAQPLPPNNDFLSFTDDLDMSTCKSELCEMCSDHHQHRHETGGCEERFEIIM